MLRRIITALVLFLLLSAPARAFSFLENTYLLNITERTRLSDIAAKLSNGGYELSNGNYVDFRKWYTSKWNDVEFHFMTQLHPDFGILWGFTTGEWGEKYRIYPGFRLGAIVQRRISTQASLSISVTRLFGSGFKEKSCTADYGAIGGVQTVNCRLAASPLEPSQTLQYLYKSKPLESWVGLRYQLSF